MTTNEHTEQSERERFEADYIKRFNKPGYLGRDKDGNYGHLMTRCRWEGWQAAALLAADKAGMEVVATVVHYYDDEIGSDVVGVDWVGSPPNSGTQLYTHPQPSALPDDVVKDAERYRFLEYQCRTGIYRGIISRAAIDAAMLKDGKE